MHYHTKNTLSPELQQIGRSRYLLFTRINAFSFGCLAESILILYALKNGADDFIVGILTSFFYLTMPCIIIGKHLVGKMGASRAYSLSWILRNLFASLMIAVPFLITIAGKKMGLALLICSAFGFFACRSMGLIANTPILGEVTNKTNRGNFISKVWMNFNIFFLITISTLMFIIGHSDKISTFQYIITFGFITGLISSSLLYRIPESISPKISAQKPTKHSIKYIWTDSSTRKLLFAWTAIVICIMLINPFTMVALKKGYFVSDHNALFYFIIQISGGILSSYFNSKILDKTGPRPMLMLYTVGYCTACIFWIFTPGDFIAVYSALIFILIGICRSGSMTAISHYFLTIVPENERVGANMFMYIIPGAVAGLAGTFLGGGMLKFLRYINFTGLEVYRIYFIIVFLIAIPLLYTIRKLEPLDDWRFKKLLGLLVSFQQIRELFSLKQLEKDNS